MPEHLCDATFVPPTGRWGYPRQLDPVRQPMRTKDGYISIAPYLDDRWVRFFHAAGHLEILQEDRFIDKATRRKNMTQMYEVAREDHGRMAQAPERSSCARHSCQ